MLIIKYKFINVKSEHTSGTFIELNYYFNTRNLNDGNNIFIYTR